eukprot:SAG31_NODE_7181_length_1763_cov_1.400240_2_plen_215_part_00
MIAAAPPLITVPATHHCRCQVGALDDALLSLILQQLSILQAQKAAQLTCRKWRELCLDLYHRRCFERRLLVTIAAANQVLVLDGNGAEVQRFTPLPPRRVHRGLSASKGSWRSAKGLYNWPTCLAVGSDVGSLYVSQYRCRGVLRFDVDASGSVFTYTRTVVSLPALESPEGLVVLGDSIYVVSAAFGTINQINLQSGQRAYYFSLFGVACPST